MGFKVGENSFCSDCGGWLIIGFAKLKPEPEGIRRPKITFSFKPKSLSVLPSTAAFVKTRVVS